MINIYYCDFMMLMWLFVTSVAIVATIMCFIHFDIICLDKGERLFSVFIGVVVPIIICVASLAVYEMVYDMNASNYYKAAITDTYHVELLDNKQHVSLANAAREERILLKDDENIIEVYLLKIDDNKASLFLKNNEGEYVLMEPTDFDKEMTD